MITVPARRLISLLPLLFVACGPESETPVFGFQAMSFANSDWSAPANLGSAINTSATEVQPTLSPDDLSLYFTSDRTGGLGGEDIWVSHRACGDCPWGTPVDLGSPVNTPGIDAGAGISIDGHLLFFFSDRPGGEGERDIYVSRRANPKDDFGWGAPVNLGPHVNTSLGEAGPEYVQSAEDGSANLYFGRILVVGGGFRMHLAAVTRDGEALGPAVLVPELNPGTGATVRTDGREVLFLSSRAGSLGANDLWMSTRRSVHEPWSTPVNPGAPLNTTFNERHPSLSGDARTLMFASTRPGGAGGEDIWISTRTPSGK